MCSVKDNLHILRVDGVVVVGTDGLVTVVPVEVLVSGFLKDVEP